MKSSRKNLFAKAAKAIGLVTPESDYLPSKEESDAVCDLLARVADRGNREPIRFSYPDDPEEGDYIDEHALHRILDDLQFGHDQRL